MEKSISNKPSKEGASTSSSVILDQHGEPSTPEHQANEHSTFPSVPQTPHLGNTTPFGAKVAIPRLPRSNEGHTSSKSKMRGDQNRVGHACEPCRHRKTKCSGERPTCQHCQDFKLGCVYMDGKRDKTRKQIGDLASRIEGYERLLEELSLRVGGSDQDLIRRALEKVSSSDEDDNIQTASSSRGRTRVSESAGEDRVSARVGSTESLDRISEDFNRDVNTRATGFHGKNSELTWMQRLKSQASHDSDDDEAYNQNLADGMESPAPKAHHVGEGLDPINNSSYHCDDLGISVHGEVNAFDTPERFVADDLFQTYLCTIHPMFPIIGKNTFIQQYNGFFSRPDRRNPNANWLAILNMIFAIGAKYSHLVGIDSRGNPDDHLIYFTRARKLAFNADAILGHAHLQKIQVTGLMAFYLLAINQINRSWAVSGFAIRHASILGLNLRNESKSVSDSSKEVRYRIWWALCTTEGTLAVMTGRPNHFAETDCTAPLPLPMEEDIFIGSQTQSPQAMQMFRRWSSEESQKSEYAMPTPTSSSYSSRVKASPGTSISPVLSQISSEERKHEAPPTNALAFRYNVRLSTITNAVLNRLYRAGTMSESWAQVQASIGDLNARLEDWRQSLPQVFDFTMKKQRDQRFARQRMSLGFSYYSTLSIINRPCLCRIDRKIPDESDRSKDFNRETAARCVNAARGMLNLLPDGPNARGLYKIAPWWILVHYLMQAATILMLELAFRADHMPNEVEEVFDAAEKALKWLRSMSEVDEAARRASVMCNGLMRQVAPKVGREANEDSNPTTDGHAYVDGVSPTEGVEQMHGVQDFQGNSTAFQSQPQFDFTTSAPFQPNMFATYDQMDHTNWPYSQMPAPSVSAPYDGIFFTGNEMDVIGTDDHDPLGYNSGPEQRWFPGSGP